MLTCQLKQVPFKQIAIDFKNSQPILDQWIEFVQPNVPKDCVFQKAEHGTMKCQNPGACFQVPKAAFGSASDLTCSLCFNMEMTSPKKRQIMDRYMNYGI